LLQLMFHVASRKCIAMWTNEIYFVVYMLICFFYRLGQT
jgi:hypothetical protein